MYSYCRYSTPPFPLSPPPLSHSPIHTFWYGNPARAAPSTDEGCPTLSLNLRWTVEEPAQPASTASTNRLSAEKDDEDAAGWTEEGESSRLGWGRATVTDAAFRDSLASARARAAKTLSRMACRYARPGTGAELPLPLAPEEDGDPVRASYLYFSSQAVLPLVLRAG